MPRPATGRPPRRYAVDVRRSRTTSPSARSRTNPTRPPTTCRARRRRRRARGQPPVRSRQRLRLAHYAASFPEAILEEDLNRAKAVTPADLLALGAAARLEPNRQLEDRVSGAQQLRRNLRFDVETVRF